MSRITKKERVYGYWQCEYCGSEISGQYSRCLNCGASAPEPAKGQKSIYYLKPNGQPVTEPTESAKQSAGPNWICSHCSSDNSDFLKVCNSCGNPRDDTDDKRATIRYGRGEQVPSTHKETFTREQSTSPSNRYKETLPQSQADPDGSPFSADSLGGARRRGDSTRRFGLSKKKSIVPTVLFFAVAAVVVYVVFFRFTYVEVTISEFAWKRAIEIQKLVTVTEEGWSVPSGGRERSRQQQIHHYVDVLDRYETREVTKSRQVYDGEETWQETVDNGDGTFTIETRSRAKYRTEYYTDYEEVPIYRKEPVYQNWYTYEIDRWLQDRVRQSAGTDQNPYWADYSLQTQERLGFQQQNYTVKVNSVSEDEIRDYLYELPEERWQHLTKQDTLVAKVSFFGKIVELTSKEQFHQ